MTGPDRFSAATVGNYSFAANINNVSSALEVQLQPNSQVPSQQRLDCVSLMWTSLCETIAFYTVVRWVLAQRQKHNVGMLRLRQHTRPGIWRTSEGRNMQTRQPKSPNRKPQLGCAAAAIAALIMMDVHAWRAWLVRFAARRRPRTVLQPSTTTSTQSLRRCWTESASRDEYIQLRDMQKVRQDLLHFQQQLQTQNEKQRQKQKIEDWCMQQRQAKPH